MDEYNWADFGSPAVNSQVSYYCVTTFRRGKYRGFSIYFPLATNLVSISRDFPCQVKSSAAGEHPINRKKSNHQLKICLIMRF